MCVESVKSCPSDYHHEIISLCENGPANYIEIGESYYWNQFCAQCNGVDLQISKPVSFTQKSMNDLELKWVSGALQVESKMLKDTHDLLAALQPKLSDSGVELTVGDESFVNLTGRVDVTCSYFVDDSLDFCQQNTIDFQGQSENYPVWNFGAISCYSPYQKVCEWYIQASQNSNKTCSSVGCNNKSILDPHSLECINLNQFVVSPQKLNDIPWNSKPLCDYQSRCKAANLGLIREEELNCYCDKFCVYFNDCCADSEFKANSSTVLESDVFGCYRDPLQPEQYSKWFLWGVTEIVKCPSGYSANSTIIELCDESLTWGHRNNLKWDLLKIPVTDPNTGLRYETMILIHDTHLIR